MLERVIEPMLRVRDALQTEFAGLHRQLLVLVRGDAVTKRHGIEAALQAQWADRPPSSLRPPNCNGASPGASLRGRTGPPLHNITFWIEAYC